jgi:hypothetical protein
MRSKEQGQHQAGHAGLRTQGRWFVVSASTAVLQKGFWAMGVIMLRNAKHGI